MVCFEWWAFEILAVFSGYISIPALASEVIIVNIVSFLFMMPLGISFSASSLTGYYIGQGKVRLAKRFALLTILLNLILSTFIILLMSLYKDSLAHLFSEDPEIIKIVQDMMWIVQLYIFVDGIHGVQSGIIRGIGKQFYGSILTLVCYYLIGMPLALGFAFKFKMGIEGLWVGFTIASILLDISFYMLIRCTNWNRHNDGLLDDRARCYQSLS